MKILKARNIEFTSNQRSFEQYEDLGKLLRHIQKITQRLQEEYSGLGPW